MSGSLTLPIPFNAFGREPEALINSQLTAVESVLRQGPCVLGPQVERFEAAWASRCGAAAAVGVANGLDAIEIGLRALGIGAGDEVITTALTAYATTLAIQRTGAQPVYADINPATACLDPAAVARCIGSATKAVLMVHLYGRAAEMTAFQAICSSHGLHVVEDCAQAHDARHCGRHVGTFGAFGAWSFYPTKNLGAVGDAGAITSDCPELVAIARQLRNYGQSDRYHHDRLGANSRLDELQAALLLQRLPHLSAWTERRRQIAARYWRELVTPSLQLLEPPRDPASHVHHLFVVRSHARERHQQELLDAGVSTLIHYPVPAHHQAALGAHRLDPAGLRHTLEHCDSCFSLPTHPALTDAEIDHVIARCNALA